MDFNCCAKYLKLRTIDFSWCSICCNNSVNWAFKDTLRRSTMAPKRARCNFRTASSKCKYLQKLLLYISNDLEKDASSESKLVQYYYVGLHLFLSEKRQSNLIRVCILKSYNVKSMILSLREVRSFFRMITPMFVGFVRISVKQKMIRKYSSILPDK